MGRTLRRHAVAALALLAACGGTPPPGRANYDRNQINAAEIEDGISRGISNAYDLIVSSRSMWLRSSRSGMGGSAAQIVVFENSNRLGNVSVLRNVPLSSIASIRFLSPSEAGAMFGLDVQNGAIQVISRTGR